MQESFGEGVARHGTRPGHMRGMRWRVVASILGGTVWLCFVLLYVAFWAPSFNVFQSVVVFFVSLIALAGALGAMWSWWGMRWAD